jgi:hypothetical protein
MPLIAPATSSETISASPAAAELKASVKDDSETKFPPTNVLPATLDVMLRLFAVTRLYKCITAEPCGPHMSKSDKDGDEPVESSVESNDAKVVKITSATGDADGSILALAGTVALEGRAEENASICSDCSAADVVSPVSATSLNVKLISEASESGLLEGATLTSSKLSDAAFIPCIAIDATLVSCDGCDVGVSLGEAEGSLLGAADGASVSSLVEGEFDCFSMGCEDGVLVGSRLGDDDGYTTSYEGRVDGNTEF